VATHIGASGTDKIRLLYKRKPCADSKTLKEIVGDEALREAEFSVMVTGGVAVEEKKKGDVEMRDAPAAHGESGMAIMRSREFWGDLREFLEQRVKSQEVALKAVGIFEAAWKQKA